MTGSFTKASGNPSPSPLSRNFANTRLDDIVHYINSLHNKRIHRIENSEMILAKHEHSRQGINHMVNYDIEAECKNPCKKHFDCEFQDGTTSKICGCKSLPNYFNYQSLQCSDYLWQCTCSAMYKFNFYIFCHFFGISCAFVTDPCLWNPALSNKNNNPTKCNFHSMTRKELNPELLSRKESEASGVSRSRIPKNAMSLSRIIRLWKFNSIIVCIALLS